RPPSLISPLPVRRVSYSLSLHDALPICGLHPPEGGLRNADCRQRRAVSGLRAPRPSGPHPPRRNAAVRQHYVEEDEVRTVAAHGDRKSTRLNSSHVNVSYAVYCSKKK